MKKVEASKLIGEVTEYYNIIREVVIMGMYHTIKYLQVVLEHGDLILTEIF